MRCLPSFSLITGLRPDQINVLGHGEKDVAELRKRRPDAVSLAGWLKDHGYETRSFGKIDHDGWQIREDWSFPPSPRRDREMWEVVDEENPLAPTRIAERTDCPVIQSPDVPDDRLFAGRMTSEVAALLESRTSKDPFFFAVGYRRPHLPFVAPKKYFDLYELDETWLTPFPEPPRDAPPLAWFNSDGYVGMARKLGFKMPTPPTREEGILWNGFELRSYMDAPTRGLISTEKQLELIHGYIACISFVDDEVGKLAEKLRRGPLVDR